jgi:uncharacterized protein (DUF2267 family)
MAATGLDVFDRTLQKTNVMLGEIEKEFGWEERRHQSYAAFRTVLHALRDRLTVQESADFAAQLPLLVKGVFYEGWNPSKVPIKMKNDEFYDRVQSEWQWSVDGNIRDVVQAVLRALCKNVSDGEMEDIAQILPRHLETLLHDSQKAPARR